MQPLMWYIRRLRVMSPAEIASRMRSSLRDTIDRCRFPLLRRPRPLSHVLQDHDAHLLPPFRVTEMPVGQWASSALTPDQTQWYRRLLEQADRIAAHRLSLFDLKDCYLGDPIDWNCDPKHQKRPPLRFAPSIDYRDFRVTGDCKFVWEPGRHQHLVTLGRAYRASGNTRYAHEAVRQLDSWLRQCPFGLGMHWRSPLELAVRLINWTWVFDLIYESGLITDDFEARFLNSVYLHLWEITRKYSSGSSRNNHRIGEAAGVFIASCYFRMLKNTSRWRDDSQQILCEEILKQTYADGGTREQAVGYHLFVLQFFALAGVVAQKMDRNFPSPYWARLEKMFEFAGALSEAGAAPMFGDSDDGYVLALGGDPRDVREWSAVGAVLYGRGDFKAWSTGYSEPAHWLLGPSSRRRWEGIPNPPAARAGVSRAFPESGYYLLQYAGSADGDMISIVFDCGELGYGPTAAHGHADALSFVLRAFGKEVLVDPGTYDYFTYPEWRRYFRGTRAHNTIRIDRRDQSEILGPFLWGRRAEARCLAWRPGADGGEVAGEHNGYAGLNDPVIHRRTIRLEGEKRVVTIRDDIFAEGQHEVELYFHLSEHCRIVRANANRYEIDLEPQRIVLEIDGRLSTETLTGSTDPIGGWVSRGYHQKVAGTTLVASCRSAGKLSLVTGIEIGRVA